MSAKTLRHKFGQGADYRLLNPGERRAIRIRRHWACLLRVMAETFGIVIAAFLLSRLVSGVGNDLWLLQSLLWYAAMGAVLRLAWEVLEWWHEIIIVTDMRFMVSKGIIARKNSFMPIKQVTDMSFQRTVVGQLLGYGTLRVESAGQKYGLETIEYLPRPEEVFPAISDLVFPTKKPHKPGRSVV